MGIFDAGGLFGKEKTETSSTRDIRQLPDYKEAAGARGQWWDTLQDWGEQPGYGAIAPDWNSIWENARGKVQRYFQGGPEGPGVAGKVKAGLARRGVSEQPGADATLARLSMAEGNQMQDMAVQQAIQEAMFGESGRQTWLGSLQSLSGMKPSFATYGTTGETTSGGGEGFEILGQAMGMASPMPKLPTQPNYGAQSALPPQYSASNIGKVTSTPDWYSNLALL